jgi:hypothetical protein
VPSWNCKPPALFEGAGRPTGLIFQTVPLPLKYAEMPTEYDHDSSYLHWTLDPKLTPRLRRGPRPICTCDLPGCLYCRRKAAQRRWYLRNRLEILAHAAKRVERESRYLDTGSLPPQGGLTDLRFGFEVFRNVETGGLQVNQKLRERKRMIKMDTIAPKPDGNRSPCCGAPVTLIFVGKDATKYRCNQCGQVSKG